MIQQWSVRLFFCMVWVVISISNIYNKMERKKQAVFTNEDSQLVESLKKKRPNQTRLDIQKLFEESVELTQIHRKLSEQNKKLKKQYQKVEQAKVQRQQFISQVQKIVKQKSSQLSAKSPHQSSWLAFKLQQKIFDLKQEIQIKDKAIRKLNLSKQNQILFRKEVEIQCLKEINQFAQENGLTPNTTDQKTESQIEDIVWMDDYLQIQKQKIELLQSQLQQEERQTKRLLIAIAGKKAEIKQLKQIQKEYFSVQESFIQEKKKKQEKTVDNKSLLTNLMKQRDAQTEKLQQLKLKRQKIQLEQKEAIRKLQERLETLKDIYQKNKHYQTNTKEKSHVAIKIEKSQQWVKRVTIQQVECVAKNLNHCLSLRGVDQQKWIAQFFKDQKSIYSIQEVIQKLSSYPFNMKNSTEKTLLARYVVQDNDPGLMLEDMNTSQDSPIIKSILTKLIGPVKVYSPKQITDYRQELGLKLCKYWSSVQHSVHIKQGVRNLVTPQILAEGINEAQVELTVDEFDYIVLFLFSWSRDIKKLELNKLGKLKQLGINFDQ